MFPESRTYIDLIEVSQALDHVHKPFEHKFVDLVNLHIDKNISFYFILGAVAGGADLYKLSATNDWELFEFKSHNIDDLKNLGFSNEGIEEILQLENMDSKLVKYNLTDYDRFSIKALIGTSPRGIDISRDSLLDHKNKKIRIRLPYGSVRIDGELFLLQGRFNLAHEPISQRIDIEAKTIRRPDPEYKTRPPYLEVECNNIFVKVDDLKAYLETKEATEKDTNKPLLELSAVQLVPHIMKSMGINPHAFKTPYRYKKDIFDKGKDDFPTKFKMKYESFSEGTNSTFQQAIERGLIKKAE